MGKAKSSSGHKFHQSLLTDFLNEYFKILSCTFSAKTTFLLFVEISAWIRRYRQTTQKHTTFWWKLARYQKMFFVIEKKNKLTFFNGGDEPWYTFLKLYQNFLYKYFHLKLQLMQIRVHITDLCLPHLPRRWNSF